MALFLDNKPNERIFKMLIDFHTHIFPDKIADKTIQILESNIKEEYKPHKAEIRGTLDALKQSMKENNIDISLVLPIATTVKQSTTINNFAASINGIDGIYSLGSLHPMQSDWESVLYDIKEKGLKGIKLHPEYQQFYIDSKESIQILQKCEELDLITVLHSGKDIGIDPPVHCTPERLAHVLDYVKGDKIVAGHLGGWKLWDDVEKYLVGTPIYFDTAFILDFITDEQLLRIIKNHGSEKILHATDSPWEKQGLIAKHLSSLPLSEEDCSNIFYKNAKKLLKIG